MGACSDADTPPTFQDPLVALDLADSALAAEHPITAAAGYNFALENGDTTLQADALVGLIKVHAGEGAEELARSAFERLSTEFHTALSSDTVFALFLVATDQQLVELGNATLAFAFQTYPEQREKLLAPFQELIKITTEVSVGNDALEELGYIGGNVDSMDDTANLLLDLEEYVGLLSLRD